MTKSICLFVFEFSLLCVYVACWPESMAFITFLAIITSVETSIILTVCVSHLTEQEPISRPVGESKVIFGLER